MHIFKKFLNICSIKLSLLSAKFPYYAVREEKKAVCLMFFCFVFLVNKYNIHIIYIYALSNSCRKEKTRGRKTAKETEVVEK